MAHPQVRPYGSWESPISAERIASGMLFLGQIALDHSDTYWLEVRPQENGRNVLMRRSEDGQTCEITTSPFDVRTRVHEYGGGAFVVGDGIVCFSNDVDQRLYRCFSQGFVRPLTPQAQLRYADGVLDRRRGKIYCIREDHRRQCGEPVTEIVRLALDGEQTGEPVVSGCDFYAAPRLSPDGARLAWLSWNHPDMPWDGTQLWVGTLAEGGQLIDRQRVAGGSRESIYQPEWSPSGVLYFVSDRSGWWNLYRWRQGRVEPLLEMEAEFGQPQWVFGTSTYALETDKRLLAAYTTGGTWHLGSLDIETGKFEEIDTPYTWFGSVRAVPGRVVMLAASPTDPVSIVEIDLSEETWQTLRRSSTTSLDHRYFSLPEGINFPTRNGQTSHAFFYPPTNADYRGPAQERPPLLVMCHGGPTGATQSALKLDIQFWTSRGIAVLDVNYSGSTGFGRAYRMRLEGQWGLVDVEDCIRGTRFLVEEKRVDAQRLAIRGSSAGGYTTLCALTFHNVFKAGASYYGVSDLEALAEDTHKFESRYLDHLVGPYPAACEIYRRRSPCHFVEQISCPVILFQGLEDCVVPPAQAEQVVAALRKRELPVAYLALAGEQHGFRRAENKRRVLEAELYFYGKIFSFELADFVKPISIENFLGPQV